MRLYGEFSSSHVRAGIALRTEGEVRERLFVSFESGPRWEPHAVLRGPPLAPQGLLIGLRSALRMEGSEGGNPSPESNPAKQPGRSAEASRQNCAERRWRSYQPPPTPRGT